LVCRQGVFDTPRRKAVADVLRQVEAVNIHLPVSKLLIQNIVLMVVPISVGYIVNLYRPEILALFAAAVMAEHNNTARNMVCFIVRQILSGKGHRATVLHTMV